MKLDSRICGVTNFVLLLALFGHQTVDAQTREEKVRNDRKHVTDQGYWIYNDLPEAFRQARKSGKPILVSMRCVPCEECVKLDEELMDNDPEFRSILDKFVCVRVIGTNGLDLGIFQFDTDQSMAMFMLNADETIYGRYGTRSHRTEWKGDVSIKGLAEALKGALVLHGDFEKHRKALQAKRGNSLEFPTPESYPSLRTRFDDKLNFAGNVVKSCIHCHQIGDARLDYYWSQDRPVPEKLMFPYPHPKSIGLVLDPDTKATVKALAPNSLAAAADLKVEDEIVSINEQPILSIADVQWVLHHAKSNGDELRLIVKRGQKEQEVMLKLSNGWRRQDDRSWRVSSWGLSAMALGGMRLENVEKPVSNRLKIPGKMALKVKHVGRYGKHAVAMQAGFKQGDIIIAYNGRTDLARETDLFSYATSELKPGQKVEIKFLREGKMRTAMLPLQKL